MTMKIIYPSWLTEDDLDRIRSMLRPTVRRSLDDCQLQLQRLSKNLDKFSKETEIFSIKNYYPTIGILPNYPDKFDAVIHLSECWSHRWFCHHAYRIKGHFDFLIQSMEAGNWTVACSLLRNIIEEIAQFDYNLGKVSEKFDIISKIKEEGKAAKNKESAVTRSLNKKFFSNCIDIVKLMSLAINRTSFNWDEYTKKIADECRIDYEKLNIEEKEITDKVNILTAIDKMSARYKEKFRKHYDILSELVHPNFGANMLVIVSKEEVDEFYELIRMSSNVRTIDGATLFFDISSELIASAFQIENNNLIRLQEIHELFMDGVKNGTFIYKQALTED